MTDEEMKKIFNNAMNKGKSMFDKFIVSIDGFVVYPPTEPVNEAPKTFKEPPKMLNAGPQVSEQPKAAEEAPKTKPAKKNKHFKV